MTDAERIAIWDAINAYALACGGETSEETASCASRLMADVALEDVLADLLMPRVEESAALREIAEAKLTAVRNLLGSNGCDCNYECDADGRIRTHYDPCLACRIQEVLHG